MEPSPNTTPHPAKHEFPEWVNVCPFEATDPDVIREGVTLRVWDNPPNPAEPERDSYFTGEFLGFTSGGDLRVLVNTDTSETLGRLGLIARVVAPGRFGIYEFDGRVQVATR